TAIQPRLQRPRPAPRTAARRCTGRRHGCRGARARRTRPGHLAPSAAGKGLSAASLAKGGYVSTTENMRAPAAVANAAGRTVARVDTFVVEAGWRNFLI